MKKWLVKDKKFDYKAMSDKYKINPVISKLLVNRNIIEDNLINTFINPRLENLHDPRQLKDIEKAVDITIKKIKDKRKIRIIGDYDVDGVISSFILIIALRKCGADVDYEIPDRVKDGYGINMDLINRAKEENIDTIITCDNGISAIEPINYAKELGMTVIVTDHHDVPFVEDEEGNRKYISSHADAIINPKQHECTYKFESLCGAGVAFKFIQVLYQELGIDLEESYSLLEFVAIATVCDVVDLIDENRIIVKYGLKAINNTENLGLKLLIKEAGIENKEISTYHLGFVIGPCINASGRLDTAKKGLRLFLTNDLHEALALSAELYNLNQERKEMTYKGVDKAIEIVETTDVKNQKVFVIYIPEVHESLAGIIAGRVKEKYNVPTIVLTKSEEVVKGSGRSIESYNMFEELLKCSDLLIKFGGHPMAAGLTLEEDNIKFFREKLNAVTELSWDDLIPTVNLDMKLPLDYINYDFINDLGELEPFGKGNNKPLFGERNIKVVKGNIIGKNKNVLKLKLLSTNGKFMDGIYFNSIEEFEEIVTNKYGSNELENLYNGLNTDIYLDIAFYPSLNKYNGNTSIQLVIQNFR